MGAFTASTSDEKKERKKETEKGKKKTREKEKEENETGAHGRASAARYFAAKRAILFRLPVRSTSPLIRDS